MKYFRFIGQIPTLGIQFESLREFQSFTLDRYMSWFTQANSHEGDKLYKTAIVELF